MGHMLCKCGHRLSTVESPSVNTITVFNMDATTKAIAENPDTLLSDFDLDYDDGYSYWYCDNCKRVYLFRDGHQMYQKIYTPRLEVSTVRNDIHSLKELVVDSDTHLYSVTENEPEKRLIDYLNDMRHFKRYFILPDNSTVFITNSSCENVVGTYVLESEFDDSVSESVP